VKPAQNQAPNARLCSLSASAKVKTRSSWHLLLLDSAANRHCIVHESILTDTRPCAVKVSVAEGTQVMAKTTGSLAANFPMCDGGTIEGSFGMALHTPPFDYSLLSAIRIVKNGGSVHLEKDDI
jgi:hypothetical protein